MTNKVDSHLQRWSLPVLDSAWLSCDANSPRGCPWGQGGVSGCRGRGRLQAGITKSSLCPRTQHRGLWGEPRSPPNSASAFVGKCLKGLNPEFISPWTFRVAESGVQGQAPLKDSRKLGVLTDISGPFNAQKVHPPNGTPKQRSFQYTSKGQRGLGVKGRLVHSPKEGSATGGHVPPKHTCTLGSPGQGPVPSPPPPSSPDSRPPRPPGVSRSPPGLCFRHPGHWGPPLVAVL